MKIGGLILKSKAVLAPLEGVSDSSFRDICYNLGAGFTWCEMIRSSAINRNNKSTLDLIDCYNPNTLTGIQLLAKSSHELIKCLDFIEYLGINNYRPHYKNLLDIQINFGCPSRDVIVEGSGPALLKRKSRLTEILVSLSEWKERNKLGVKSVGCKIRLGINKSEMDSKVYLNAVEAANIAKLDYLVVHARHARQKSSDLPDWNAIAYIKEKSNIPIIGNGNVFDFSNMNSIMKLTGCDGVMISRGAMRNPWVFKSIIQQVPCYWPNLNEVIEKENEYNRCTNINETNNKYKEFHTKNFERLKQSIILNNHDIMTLNPSKIYL